MRCPLAILAVILCACELVAQPGDLGYEPPAGWTYLNKLDSNYFYVAHTFNDTLVLQGYNQHRDYYQKPVNLISLNGGVTLDTITLAKELEVTSYSQGLIPNSTEFYRLINKKDSCIFRISYDLGKSFTDHFFVGKNLYYPRVVASPYDNMKIFIVTAGGTNYRSNDGGRSWQEQKMPHNGGPYTNGTIELVFDVRNSNIWNVLASGADHYSKSTTYYRTTDDGLTFQKINVWGEYSGIKSEGVVRKWWNIIVRSTDYLETGLYGLKYQRGVMDFINDKDTTFKNWAGELYNSPVESLPKVYGQGVQVGGYIFYTSNPHHAFIAGGELYRDTFTDSIIKQRYDIWETKNDGETWNSIWTPGPMVQDFWLDEKTNTLYVLSRFRRTNEPASPLQGDIAFESALWKRQISTSVEDNTQSPVDFKNITIAPNPIVNYTKIAFKNSKAGKVEISLHDILGTKLRTIYSGQQEAGEQKLMWNIPAEIPSGTYFLKLESGGQSVTEKIVIMR